MDKLNKKSLFDGVFGRYFLPGIVLQSVLIGGGYATGREIVAFGAKYGALGWISGLSILVGFALIAFLTFGIARKYKVYDYKSLVQIIIGPFWFIYEILYLGMLIVTLAVMASATGSILESTLGLNYWIGVIGIMIVVGILNFYGEKIIEKFKTFGTIALYMAYLIFGLMVISSNWDNVLYVFETGSTNFASDASLLSALWTGILYFSFCIAVFPSALFTIKRHKTSKDTLISSLVAGVLMLVPWFITYFALMGFYSSKEVMGADVPWLQMLNGYGSWVVIIFGVVVGWTLIETSTGYIHAFIDRLDRGFEESGKRPTSKIQKGLIAVGMLFTAVILSKFGVVALIERGYTALAYGLFFVYFLPLLTVGSYKLITKKKEKEVMDSNHPSSDERQSLGR